MSNRYDPEKTLHLEKFNPKKAVSAVYVDGESKQYMVKRFNIETSTADKEFGFISEGIGSRLVVISTAESPEIEVEVLKGKDKAKKTETLSLDELVDVKGWKALGNRLSEFKVTKVNLVQDEDTGLEEGDEGNELVDTDSEKDSESQKKNGKQIRQRSGKTAKSASSQPRKNQNTKSSKSQSQNQKSKPNSKTSSGKSPKAGKQKPVKKKKKKKG